MRPTKNKLQLCPPPPRFTGVRACAGQFSNRNLEKIIINPHYELTDYHRQNPLHIRSVCLHALSLVLYRPIHKIGARLGVCCRENRVRDIWTGHGRLHVFLHEQKKVWLENGFKPAIIGIIQMKTCSPVKNNNQDYRRSKEMAQ